MSDLTPRETDLLVCAANGLRRPAAARKLGLSESTVPGYWKTIHLVLGTNSQTEAVAVALRLGWIPYPDATIENALARIRHGDAVDRGRRRQRRGRFGSAHRRRLARAHV